MISIDLFGELKQNTIVSQQRGELYMRIFRYACEDFANHQDIEVFCTNLIAWAESIEVRMETLSTGLVNHTHPITPHIHPVPPHTHSIAPHIHIAPPSGGATTAAALATDSGTLSNTNQNEPIPTEVPSDPSTLQWPHGTIPTKYINTSGVVSNIASNKVVPSSSVIGDATIHPRRTVVVPEAAIPNIPPYLAPTII